MTNTICALLLLASGSDITHEAAVLSSMKDARYSSVPLTGTLSAVLEAVSNVSGRVLVCEDALALNVTGHPSALISPDNLYSFLNTLYARFPQLQLWPELRGEGIVLSSNPTTRCYCCGTAPSMFYSAREYGTWLSQHCSFYADAIQDTGYATFIPLNTEYMIVGHGLAFVECVASARSLLHRMETWENTNMWDHLRACALASPRVMLVVDDIKPSAITVPASVISNIFAVPVVQSKTVRIPPYEGCRLGLDITLADNTTTMLYIPYSDVPLPLVQCCSWMYAYVLDKTFYTNMCTLLTGLIDSNANESARCILQHTEWLGDEEQQ